MKKISYVLIFVLIVFVSGQFDHGSFWGIKKVFGYGGSSGGYASQSSVTKSPIIKTIPVTPVSVLAPTLTPPILAPAAPRVLGATTFKFNQHLTLGSEGEDVRKLQEVLQSLGHFKYIGGPTGYYGPATRAAVVLFQKANIDKVVIAPGWVGPATRDLLNNLSDRPAVLSQIALAKPLKPQYKFDETLMIGSNGTAVERLQNWLTEKGFYNGPVTGFFGNLTYQAIKKLQLKNGLAQVGIVGPKTREILNQ